MNIFVNGNIINMDRILTAENYMDFVNDNPNKIILGYCLNDLSDLNNMQYYYDAIPIDVRNDEGVTYFYNEDDDKGRHWKMFYVTDVEDALLDADAIENSIGEVGLNFLNHIHGIDCSLGYDKVYKGLIANNPSTLLHLLKLKDIHLIEIKLHRGIGGQGYWEAVNHRFRGELAYIPNEDACDEAWAF